MGKEEGAPALLFDKLVDQELGAPSEPNPLRKVTREQLYRSIQQEVQRLLNTRIPIAAKDMEDVERTVINYGVPDFGSFTTTSGVDHDSVARYYAEAISAYEPRLRDVRVKVVPLPGADKALQALIEATIAVGPIVEQVSFPVHISAYDAK